MRDHIIRQAFHKSVLKSAHIDTETFVVDELGLKNGEIRADIAVLNGKLIGFEIKTEKDTLSRLPSQVVAYSEIFDKAFIVVSENHLHKAVELIPDWWGIYTIKTKEEGDYSFINFRRGKINKYQESYSLAQLLWKSEALDLANTIIKNGVKPKTPKHEVYDFLSKVFAPKQLSKIVLKYLKQRENWRKDHALLL
ncbi:sce7726 family protein [Sediminibacterium sp.]|uniref:sce7726 family protein n=1 Tax=Sediminibacterium sp. TaxID=1917865 RepID=UPI003F6A1217